MRADLCLLPDLLQPEQIIDRAVVVFDVLRASTTIIAALSAGIHEIHVYDTLDGARHACSSYSGKRILCGESGCLPPKGFDLGNSPGVFNLEQHRDATLFMCTTNGTRAIHAARSARLLLIGALTNANAVAEALRTCRLNFTLLCAGTSGSVAIEDVIGAGAVLRALSNRGAIGDDSDGPSLARTMFDVSASDLSASLRRTRGGQNVMAAGLEPDIDFAARLNTSQIVPQVFPAPLRIRKMAGN